MPLALPQSKAAVMLCQRQALCSETARWMPCTLTGLETGCFVSFFLDALFRGPPMRTKGRKADYLLYLHDRENGPLYFPLYCYLSFLMPLFSKPKDLRGKISPHMRSPRSPRLFHSGAFHRLFLPQAFFLKQE